MRLFTSRKGQGMTEYILIIALVAVLIIGAVKAFGGKVKEGFSKSTEKVGSAIDDGMKESGKED